MKRLVILSVASEHRIGLPIVIIHVNHRPCERQATASSAAL